MDSSQPVQIYLLIMSEVARSNVLRRSLGEIEAAWERGDFATIVLGERVVAAAAILEFSHCIKIGSVVVCEDCRGRGYGREVVAKALEIAKGRTRQWPIVAVVNSHSLKIFLELGFEVRPKSDAAPELWGGRCRQEWLSCEREFVVYVG